ncbi:hypothetical protein [Qaidamihabitans albus]|uniref:hypothetical protein n=1 Tax=Qaidamihabitans albus TaxID=2795733 RepID=UPI0018F10DAB|nr:hypothetical protein [Qaidamihabitans albus]
MGRTTRLVTALRLPAVCLLGGEHVFCVSFALQAPYTGEVYEPGEELLTGWAARRRLTGR